MSIELFDAIKRHDLDRLAAVLSGGADPNAPQPPHPDWYPLHEGWHPLHAAINELEDGGPIECLILLLRHGAEVEGGGVKDTPLLMALFRGQLEAVRVLLAARANPNVTGAEGD